MADLRSFASIRWLAPLSAAIVLSTLLFASLGHSTQDVHAIPGTGTLFGTDASGGNLLTIDQTTGASNVVGNMAGPPFPSLAVDTSTGVMFAGGGGGLPDVYTVDPLSGTTTFLGPSGLGFAAIGGMDFRSDGTLFAAVNIAGDGGTGSDHLATIDTTTGAATIVGPFGRCTGVVVPSDGRGSCTIEGIEGIAFDASGILWGSLSARGDAGAPGLYIVSAATGAATFMASIDNGSSAPTGGVVSLQFGCDGILYGGTARGLGASDGGFLGTITTSSGAFSFVGATSATGGSSLGALAALEVCPAGQGRMTGGGSVFTEDNVRVTHGFTLHCNLADSPNNLEVNWDGDSFHLESLDFALCTDDPNIDPNPPTADFDTHEGEGGGRYNGVSGATALWTFTDAGQPGRNDTAAIRIFDAGGDLVLEVANNLNSGNHQAHSGGPPKGSPSPPATATPPSTPPPAITVTPTDTPVVTPAATPTATPTVTPTPPSGKKPEMALTVKGADCDDPFRPTKCNVPTGSPFILSVDVLNAPADGYILLQTFIDYGPLLTYKPAPSANDEIVWPDAVISVRAELGPGLVNHGALAGLIPPIPPSFFEGNVVELLMNCTPFPSSNDLELIPAGDPVAETNGTSFQDPDGAVIIPNLGPFTINCDDALIALADTDGDGCADLQELGPDEQSGGQRDPHNPWDFYDTNGDGVIDLTNDIFGVILAYGTDDVTYDRGPSAGPNVWNMTAPDGLIDLSNDILGVIQQYQHSCA